MPRRPKIARGTDSNGTARCSCTSTTAVRRGCGEASGRRPQRTGRPADERGADQYFIPPAWANSFIIRSCSSFSFSGTVMVISTIRSPFWPFLSIPWPRTRKRFPAGVPGGILSATFLSSSVFTLMREPSVAWAMLIGTVATTSSPSRRKKRSGLTWKVITRSPAGPPFTPRPPCPLSRILVPVSAPAGTVMFTFFRDRTSPAPPQVGQRSVGTWPRPRHIGHGRLTAKLPWPKETVPRPLHSGQVLSVAPGAAPLPLQVSHSSVTSISTCTLPPSAAVRKSTSIDISTVWPCSGPRARPRPAVPPPNIAPNRSPRPPSPPMSKSSNDPPPGPPAPPPKPPPGRVPAPPELRPPRPAPPPKPPKPPNAPSRRISSYCFRFSESPTTLYASEISLNLSAAFGSLALASGWYFFARRRYCFLISSWVAVDETPRTA